MIRDDTKTPKKVSAPMKLLVKIPQDEWSKMDALGRMGHEPGRSSIYLGRRSLNYVIGDCHDSSSVLFAEKTSWFSFMQRFTGFVTSSLTLVDKQDKNRFTLLS